VNTVPHQQVMSGTPQGEYQTTSSFKPAEHTGLHNIMRRVKSEIKEVHYPKQQYNIV